MFIQTETTPNPATLKFLPGCEVSKQGTADFTSPAAAGRSPMAIRLFAIEGVTGAFLGTDFITVTKAAGKDWAEMKPFILSAIMEQFASGAPVIEEEAGGPAGDDVDDETSAQIKDLLDTRVRPAVAQDGGDIIFRGFKNGIVYLHMQGACSGCPSSTATLKHGIENMLRYYIPAVMEVRAVD